MSIWNGLNLRIKYLKKNYDYKDCIIINHWHDWVGGGFADKNRAV